jgi:ABC-type dipeptide/oligopeptide/nickel transport system permease component
MAIIAQLTRGSMLDILNQDYIRTAYAKGLSPKQVSGSMPFGIRSTLITAIAVMVCEDCLRCFFCRGIYFRVEGDW